MTGAHEELLALALPLVAFWAFFGARMTRPDARRRFRGRDARAWALDATGLLAQGWVVPLGAGWLGRTLWAPLVPAGVLEVGWLGGLTISLVFVDLLYYLNHRVLHVAWPLHRVHHSAADMDVWVSARNTAWSTAFIVYPWANSLFLHVLDAPGGFLLGAAITASLDLWRHSGLPGMGLARLGLITPRQHAWHHGTERHDVNFGANWSWWDRLFGTFHDPGHDPTALGVPSGLSTWRELLWPFGGERGRA
jgi:sterol desaturase/sphingolipid hydroxylase (fatty acid hydroxylase superfamily)